MPSPPWARYDVGDAMGPFTVESVELEMIGPDQWMERIVNSGRVVHQILRKNPTKPLLFSPPNIQADTRIVVPYVPHYNSGGQMVTERNPETVSGAPKNAEWINVEGSDWNYWSLLCTLWSGEHNLILIEHDVTYQPEFTADFEACGCDWAFHNYHHFDPADAEAWHWGILGCTWFSKNLMEREPDLMTGMRPGFRHWTELSTGVGVELRKRGYAPHEHFPRVVHHAEKEWGPQ